MKKFKIYMITALATMICCSLSVNAEETTDIQDTAQTTEAVDITEPIEELTEATEPTEYTDTTEAITTESTTITTVSETAETTVTTITEIDESRPFGDVNKDYIFNVRDAAYLARHISLGTLDELDMYYADYNSDGKIDVRDCAKIAKDITEQASHQATEQRKGLPTCPNKSDYDLTTDNGMKAYVNDMTRYKAFTKYGITAVAYDDTVDVWNYSWDVPEVYLADVNSYMAENNGVLMIGSNLYELPQSYIDSGWAGMFHVAEDESEMADILVEGQTVALDMMISEGEAQGRSGNEFKKITLSWQPIDGVGNYEVYLLWGTKGKFEDLESYKEYHNMTDEMFEYTKERWYAEDIALYETYGDEYMAEKTYRTYEDLVLENLDSSTEMSWSVYKETVLQIGTYEDPNDYSWLSVMTPEQGKRFNDFIAELSLEEVNELMKDLRTACLNDTVDEYLDEIGA